MPKILKRDDQKLICTASILLAGVAHGPGDALTPATLAKIPLKNLDALLSTGALAPPSEFSDEERDLHKRRGETQIELTNVKAIHVRIRNDKLGAAQRVEALTQERAAGVFATYRGGEKPDGGGLQKARDELSDLETAEAQAVEEVKRLTKEVKSLDRQGELVRAGKVRDERLVLAKEIMAGIDKLAPLFEKFAGTASHFERLVRSGSNQVASDWRLSNLIDEHLLFRAVKPDLKVKDLGEIEARIYGGVLDRAVRELEKQDG